MAPMNFDMNWPPAVDCPSWAVRAHSGDKNFVRDRASFDRGQVQTAAQCNRRYEHAARHSAVAGKPSDGHAPATLNISMRRAELTAPR
jgi:hypothetical protein